MIQEWAKFLQPYEQAVEELKVKLKAIRDQYRELSEYSPIEFTTGRVKKISSILEKAERMSIPLDRLQDEMEDIAGLRIMCQFIDDIYSVAELIRERSGKDFKVLYEKDYIKNAKPSGYRSYHMIIRYPVYTAKGAREILVELQIRTLAMNFWATIEHSLQYKYKDAIPEEIVARLRNASDAATRLDEEMTLIAQEIRQAQTLFEEKSNTVREITRLIGYLSSADQMDRAMLYQARLDALKPTDRFSEYRMLLDELRRVVSESVYHKQSGDACASS
ncbi:MAG: GTP pyrophosphokinase family protein [Bacillota bacterium]|nr:GTP pyrophosphokinase family protein [Bacillota bacterium]